MLLIAWKAFGKAASVIEAASLLEIIFLMW